MNVIHKIGIGVVAVVSLLAVSPVHAFSLYSNGGFESNLSLELGAGLFSTDNAGFGAGGWGAGQDDSVGWHEMYAKPVLDISYSAENIGTVYGGLSMVASSTYGDGDVAGFTDSDSDGWESEQAYLGFKTALLSVMGIDNLDISAGEQEFTVGDGFLIADAEFDSRYGSYWMAPRKSFKKTAIIKADIGALHSDLFYLMSDADYDDTELYGVNIEYSSDALGTIGGSYMTVTDANLGGWYENRKGMDIYSVRGQGSAGIENLFLAAEYVRQSGGDRQDVDADAYYAEIGYTLAACPWSPTLSYKYAFFSGDADGDFDAQSHSGDMEAFDPLFYGFLRGWGSHYMGEIVGEYYLFNSNQKTHMVKFDVTPNEALTMGVIYYDFSLDEVAAGEDDHFAEEINMYADYAVNDNLYLTAVFAWATPKGAAQSDMWGLGDQDMKLFEIAAFLYF